MLSDGRHSIKATNAGKFFENNTSNTVTLTVNGPGRNNRAKWEFNRVAAAKNAIGKTEELAIDLEAIPSNHVVKSVKLFPNPVAVTGTFSIKLNGQTKAEITITNLLGKTVYKTTVESNILELNKANKFFSRNVCYSCTG